MKRELMRVMKRNPGAGVLCATAMTFLSTAVTSMGQTVISEGHVDWGVLYEEGSWDLHVHKASPAPEEEFAPGDAVLRVGQYAQLAGGVPNNASAVSFFGTAGSPLWVLPKNAEPGLPFLGVGAEEMSASDWSGELALRLESVAGPGNFFVWDVGAFGDLQPRMSSRDGIGPTDRLTLEAGSHAHYFWAFSAPGDYEISVSASGTHATDGPVASEPVSYRFQVVPEPRVGLLLVAGAVLLGGLVRRRNYGV